MHLHADGGAPGACRRRILEIGCGLRWQPGRPSPRRRCHRQRLPSARRRLPRSTCVSTARRRCSSATATGRRGDAPRAEPHPGGRIVHGRFDLVIGSDVLYERDEHAKLAGFIGRHTCRWPRCGSSTPIAATGRRSTGRWRRSVSRGRRAPERGGGSARGGHKGLRSPIARRRRAAARPALRGRNRCPRVGAVGYSNRPGAAARTRRNLCSWVNR